MNLREALAYRTEAAPDRPCSCCDYRTRIVVNPDTPPELLVGLPLHEWDELLVVTSDLVASGWGVIVNETRPANAPSAPWEPAKGAHVRRFPLPPHVPAELVDEIEDALRGVDHGE